MASDIGSVTWKVTPEVLKNKSENVGRSVGDIKNRFEEIKRIVNNTSGYWLGEAGEKHRKVYKDKENDIAAIFKRLDEHVTELGEMAKVYTDTENSIQTIIKENLPSNVIL